MLVVANRNNLKAHARALLGNDYTPEKEQELIRAALAGVEPSPRWVHPSHRQAAHLEKLDAILGTYGVETYGGEGSVQPDVQYCNTGDTYGMTLLYYRGKLRIGDWGSIVEAGEA